MSKPKNDDLMRVGVRIPSEVKSWVVEQSAKMGLTQAQFISLMLYERKQQFDSLDAITQLKNAYKELGADGIKSVASDNEKLLALINEMRRASM